MRKFSLVTAMMVSLMMPAAQAQTQNTNQPNHFPVYHSAHGWTTWSDGKDCWVETDETDRPVGALVGPNSVLTGDPAPELYLTPPVFIMQAGDLAPPLVASRATKLKSAALYVPRKTWAGAKKAGRGIVWVDERPTVQKAVHVAQTIGSLASAFYFSHNLWSKVH